MQKSLSRMPGEAPAPVARHATQPIAELTALATPATVSKMILRTLQLYRVLRDHIAFCGPPPLFSPSPSSSFFFLGSFVFQKLCWYCC